MRNEKSFARRTLSCSILFFSLLGTGCAEVYFPPKKVEPSPYNDRQKPYIDGQFSDDWPDVWSRSGRGGRGGAHGRGG